MKHLLLAILLSVHVSSLQAQQQNAVKIPASFDIEYVDLNFESDLGRLLNDILIDDQGFLCITASKGPFIFDGQRSYNLFKNPNYNSPKKDSLIAKRYLFGSCLLDSILITFNKYPNNIIVSKWADKTFEKRIDLTNEVINVKAKSSKTDWTIFVTEDKITQQSRIYKIDQEGKIDLLKRSQSKITSIHHDEDYIAYRRSHSLYNHHVKTGDIDSVRLRPEKMIGVSHHIHFYKNQLVNIHGTQIYIHQLDDLNNYRTINIPEEIVANTENARFEGPFLFIGNYSHLYIYNFIDNSYQDLSEVFLNLKKEYAPERLTDVINDVLVHDDVYYILLEQNLLLLKEKQKSREDFFIPMPGANPSPSMRGLDMSADSSLYVSYYNGISVLKKGNDFFEPLGIHDNLEAIVKQPMTLHTYGETLFSCNTMIADQGIKSLDSDDVYMSHSASLLESDTLYFIRHYSEVFKKYAITQDSLYTKKLEDSSKNDVCNDLALDPLGRGLWMASSYYGLQLLNRNGKLLKKLPLQEDYDCGYIHDLEIIDHKIYCATLRGLVIVDLNSYEINYLQIFDVDKYNYKKPICMYTLLTADNKILIGASDGLYAFDLKTNNFLSLPSDHPLMGLEYNRQSKFSLDSTFYFGTTNGLYSFTLSDLDWQIESPEVKNIELTHFTYNGKSKQQTQSIAKNKYVFDPHTNNIQISYSSPNLTLPVYYSYRISSIDTSWSSFSKENTLKIFKLPKGDHPLEIRASTIPLEQNIRYKSILLTQRGLWYTSIWAYLMYAFLFASLLYFLYRYRLQQVIKYQNLRTKISSDLHDDVGSILTAVAMQSEILGLDAAPEKVSKFNKLSELARQAMSRMRDTVWAIDARKDNVQSLVYRMLDHLSDSLEDHRLKYTFDYDESQFNQSISPDIRQTVYLIFKEAVANATKYSKGNEIKIKLDFSRSKYYLEIHDNGQSIANLSKSSGLGLSNMRLRAKRIGAELLIDNSDGFLVSLSSADRRGF